MVVFLIFLLRIPCPWRKRVYAESLIVIREQANWPKIFSRDLCMTPPKRQSK